jgi:hypothetical protein
MFVGSPAGTHLPAHAYSVHEAGARCCKVHVLGDVQSCQDNLLESPGCPCLLTARAQDASPGGRHAQKGLPATLLGSRV